MSFTLNSSSPTLLNGGACFSCFSQFSPLLSSLLHSNFINDFHLLRLTKIQFPFQLVAPHVDLESCIVVCFWWLWRLLQLLALGFCLLCPCLRGEFQETMDYSGSEQLFLRDPFRRCRRFGRLRIRLIFPAGAWDLAVGMRCWGGEAARGENSGFQQLQLQMRMGWASSHPHLSFYVVWLDGKWRKRKKAM